MEVTEKSGWKQAALHELGFGWKRWVSFACIWLWTCIVAAMMVEHHVLSSLPGILSVTNEVTIITNSATLLLILVFSKFIRSIVDSRRSMILAGLSLTVGSLCFLIGSFYVTPLWFVLGMGFGGIAIGVLKIAWGEMFSRMTLAQGLIAMGYALILSTVVMLLIYNLPLLGKGIILVIASLPCAHLAFQGTRELASPAKEKTAEPIPTKHMAFSPSLLFLPAMVGISYGIVAYVVPFDASSGLTINVSSNYAELITGIMLLVFSYFLGKKFGAGQIYAYALIFVVAGIILIAAQIEPVWPGYFIHKIGFSVFYFFMVVYWGNLARRTGMHIVRIYTIGYFTFQVCQIPGSVIAYYAHGNESQNFLLLILLAVILLFFVVALLLFSSSHSPLRQWLIADERTETTDDIPVACAEISQTYGLSPRESEVLALLARGRNASYVARTLCISPDTAKTHIKNIYRKLDIHTHQQLIDIIESTIG